MAELGFRAAELIVALMSFRSFSATVSSSSPMHSLARLAVTISGANVGVCAYFRREQRLRSGPARDWFLCHALAVVRGEVKQQPCRDIGWAQYTTGR